MRSFCDGDHILATHQAEPVPEIQLPGGGIDKGEQPIPALHREVYEETGWKIAVTRQLGAFRRFTYMPEYDLWAEKLCTVYLARPVLRLGPPSPRRGIRLCGYPSIDALGLRLGNAGDRGDAGPVSSGRDDQGRSPETSSGNESVACLAASGPRPSPPRGRTPERWADWRETVGSTRPRRNPGRIGQRAFGEPVRDQDTSGGSPGAMGTRDGRVERRSLRASRPTGRPP